jgi:Domain of unknown function (DUF397)
MNSMTDMDLTGAIWRKSTRSGGATNCVEVAGGLPEIVAVRDSKDPSGPKITFAVGAWDTFTAGVKNGEC